MNKGILWGIVIVVVVVGGVMLMNQSSAPEVMEHEMEEGMATSTTETATTTPMTPVVTSSAPQAGAVKTFTVSASNFKFSVLEMKVKKGDKVKVVFTDQAGSHDWRLDGYNVGTKVLQSGQSETVEFVADKAGTFEFYCSVGTHRQMGMKGNFIVE